MKKDTSLADLKEQLKDKEWRMSNLYYVINKYSKKVLFTPNKTQKLLIEYVNSHPRNVILKASEGLFEASIEMAKIDMRSSIIASLGAHIPGQGESTSIR